MRISGLVSVLTEMVTPKYEIYRNKIYNGNGMVKPVAIPFPLDLNQDDWKRIGQHTRAPPNSESDLNSKGYSFVSG